MKGCVIHVPQRLAGIDKCVDKQRAKYLRHFLVIVYTEHGQWQASFIWQKSACLAEVSVSEHILQIPGGTEHAQTVCTRHFFPPTHKSLETRLEGTFCWRELFRSKAVEQSTQCVVYTVLCQASKKVTSLQSEQANEMDCSIEACNGDKLLLLTQHVKVPNSHQTAFLERGCGLSMKVLSTSSLQLSLSTEWDYSGLCRHACNHRPIQFTPTKESTQ